MSPRSKRRNKIIMFLPSLITTSVLQLFVIASAYFMWVLMNESGCTTIQNRVLVPFIGTIPFTFLMGILGPYGYMAHNTWGTGMRITEVMTARKEIDDLWAIYDDDESGDLVKCATLRAPCACSILLALACRQVGNRFSAFHLSVEMQRLIEAMGQVCSTLALAPPLLYSSSVDLVSP